MNEEVLKFDIYIYYVKWYWDLKKQFPFLWKFNQHKKVNIDKIAISN